MGELTLKGLNRSSFEKRLMHDVARRLGPGFVLESKQSTLYVDAVPGTQPDWGTATDACQKVFGIVSVCRSARCGKDIQAIRHTAAAYCETRLRRARTFKVEAKRADKRFPMTSPQIMEDVGAYLLETFPYLTVDVRHPDETVWVEIREDAAFVHLAALPGAAGLPSGTAGRAMLLLSGGIDSPVAGFLCARRGLALTAVHFYSYPYTSPEAKDKVLRLAETLAGYAGPMTVHCLPFTEIQETLRRRCPDGYVTILSRRMMMRAAEKIAWREGCGALVTGESLAQVASQTLPSMAVTDAVCRLPVLRPLVGLDKEEIIQRARKIGTYETSILPYEDCCTVFTPKHPKTRPTPHQTEAAERCLPIETLLMRCIQGSEKIEIPYL